MIADRTILSGVKEYNDCLRGVLRKYGANVARIRPRNTSPVRYYIYISDAKLDMLYEQVAYNTRKSISAELKLDLKIAGLTIREAPNPGPTRMAKLQIVERFIRTHRRVGSVLEPGQEFFGGQMDMKWGFPYAAAGWDHRDDMVWFQGSDPETLQCVGLGGSRHHVLGEGAPQVIASSSQLPLIMEFLFDGPFRKGQEITTTVAHKGGFSIDWPFFVDWPLRPNASELYRSPLHVLPSQHLEFLAISLFETTVQLFSDAIHMVIGTPLYVALASKHTESSLR